MQLYTTNQAAQILNISLQGVHYRIKNGTLKAVKQNGKTYVYIDPSMIEQKEDEPKEKKTIKNKLKTESLRDILVDKIVEAKNEQIVILKKTIKQIKKQYQTEIDRLQSNNEKEIARLTQNQERIIEVFSSEIKLLQQAFQEMKNVYMLGVKKEDNNDDKEEKIKKKKKDKKKKKEHKQDLKEEKDLLEYKEKKKKEKIDIQNKEKVEEKIEKEEISKEELSDEEIINQLKEMTKPKTIDIKEFYARMRRYNKTDSQIKHLIMQRVMLGDERFEYDKVNKKLTIYDKDFSDLI